MAELNMFKTDLGICWCNASYLRLQGITTAALICMQLRTYTIYVAELIAMLHNGFRHPFQ